MESILTSIKKQLGITEEYKQFDAELIIHINTVFMILHQLGVGPSKCFSITSSMASWSNFTSDIESLEAVKTYMYLKVRMVFDPPTSSALIAAYEKQISELEWRLNVQADIMKEV